MSAEHGTFWASNAGCRCELCEDAREDRVRDYVAQRTPRVATAIRSSACTFGGASHKECSGWYGSSQVKREGLCACECHTVTRS